MSSHIWVFSIRSAVWNGWLVGSFSPRRPGSNPKTVHVRFVADKKGVGTGFSIGISVPLVSIIPPKQHNHFHVNTTFYQDKRKKPGNIQTKKCSLGYREAYDRKILSQVLGWMYPINICRLNLCIKEFFVMFYLTEQQNTLSMTHSVKSAVRLYKKKKCGCPKVYSTFVRDNYWTLSSPHLHILSPGKHEYD
jgi:hypothetical protein